ncbi:steroid delta-isomerase [Endozoicomonas montiporae]|uniref:Steroid delta-isomerase n=2 Tax=Endozoicomonas montiporae TaxID=1027273 RepID=A0A081N8E2_9GAMM|nr:NAD-dependent epimerase/dehydratase family protein [Endozoicomonas montiporae]AMO55395.1 3-beta hydroxysteroid dehydrogenase/isomerase [Endozoicomonas montiporae CL-33]KEQ14715.1 steroid delta-isomerase [Endozoicomonas montiporae]
MNRLPPLPVPADPGRVLVTGGSGFLGHHLVQTLLNSGYKVRSLDRIKSNLEHHNLEVMRGDIRDKGDAILACEGIDTVFHTAAIMDTRSHNVIPESTRQLSYEINLEGTKNIVESAMINDVERLVYTSTSSVVIDGQPIAGGDESLPYASNFRDLYTETKTKAEQLVLAANGTHNLYTCALRPSGIWGPGDQMMFKIIIEQLVNGSFKTIFGNGSARLNHSYIHNLVHGQILAAQQLSQHGNAPGQAYFINDGEPVNIMDLSSPLIQALGYQHPAKHVSYRLAKQTFQVWEKLHQVIKLPKPPRTIMALERVSMDNYFSIEKARVELGYSPLFSREDAWEDSIPYYRELHDKIRKEATLRKATYDNIN